MNQKYLFQQILELVQKTLGYQLKYVMQQALNNMLKKQYTKSQAKLYISSKGLRICLNIIKLINKKVISYFKQIILDPFKLLNKFNRNILSYLKSKYPRNKNLFISHELQQKFEQINFLTVMEYNIVRNSGFCFTTYNYKRSETLGKIKRFLNFLMDQINNNFDYFSILLKKEVFAISDLNFNVNKIKIGRKIPENVERFYDFQSQNLDISSPEIFRVIIKWIQPLVDLFQNPAEQFNSRSQIKYFKQISENYTQYYKIRSKRYEDIKTNLIQKILDNKVIFQQKFSKLVDHLDNFNNNLAKILMFRKSHFKFLPQDQIQNLKFAKYNTEFLEWIVVEKLLILVQQLSRLTQYFQKKYLKKIDFINFNVYDLLRASFSGTKNQIFQIFENLKKIQSKNKITILRVKNRIDTPLNDVLINLKFQKSILICQLQLIMIQNQQQAHQKLKNIQDLNHIIYQLQRSPYGSISQMALTIGYSDPSIQYQSKIKFQTQWTLQSNCQKQQEHQFQDIKVQEIPFVCSWCLKYYARLQNFFQVHKCKKCSFNKCKSCIFQQDKQEQKRVVYKYLTSCLLNISLERIGQNKDQDYFQNLFSFGKGALGFLMESYIRVRDQIEMSKQAKLKKLQKILYKKQQQYDLKGEQPFYCLLLHFSKGKCNIIVLKYVNFRITIASDKQKQSKRLLLEQFDIIFLFPPRVFKSVRSPHIVCETFNNKQNFIDIRNGKKIQIDKLRYQVTYISYLKKRILIQIDQENSQQITTTKKQIKFQQAFQKLKQTIAKCQSFTMAKKDINVSKYGISSENLTLILTSTWKNQIKVLNIDKNKIVSIEAIFDELNQLQQLSAGFNFISSLKITKMIPLEVLNLESNCLNVIQENINLLVKLQFLNLNCNKIQKIQKIKLKFLEELNLKKNKINNLSNLAQSQLQNLKILQLSENIQKQGSNLQIEDLKFYYLKKLDISNVNMSSNSKFDMSALKILQYIDASFNKISKLESLSQKQLRQVIFNNCQIINIQETFTDKLSKLLLINLENNQIKLFPVFKLQTLQTLKLTHNKIQDIQNLSYSFLPKLEHLDLSINQIININPLSKISLPELKQLILLGNKIQEIPCLKFPKLLKLILMRNKIASCEKLSISFLPMLKLLNIKQNKVVQLPKLNFKNLRQFFPQNNQIRNIEQFCHSQLSSLKLLSIWNNKIQILPILNFSQIETMYLYSNTLKSVQSLQHSNLSKLKKLSLIKNNLKSLPILKMNFLQIIYAYNNQIQNIKVLQKWQTPELKYLQLSHNKIIQIPNLTFYKLNQLYLHYNNIAQIQNFYESKLSSLKKISFENNKIKFLNKFSRFNKLKQINLSKNQIESLGTFGTSDLPKLQRLYLGMNKIAHINQFWFPALQELSLQKNRLQQLSSQNNHQISYNLKKLYLADNKINKFPQILIQKCQIQQLSLSRNWLKQITISSEQKIKKLLLVGCGLTDKSLSNIILPSLQQLNLKNNHLQKIQFLMKKGAYEGLKKIFLDNNRIQALCTLNLEKLEQLHLSNNKIQKFQQFLLSKLPSLMLINLKSQKKQAKNLLSQLKESVPIEQKSQENTQSVNAPLFELEDQVKLERQESLQVKVQQNSEFIQKIKQAFSKITIKI